MTGLGVSALAAEWIEIAQSPTRRPCTLVSALAAEWIEIRLHAPVRCWCRVSALAAEWIEIRNPDVKCRSQDGLRPRGGVD